MKFFKLFEDWNQETLHDELNEASIFDPKYDNTQSFVLSTSGNAFQIPRDWPNKIGPIFNKTNAKPDYTFAPKKTNPKHVTVTITDGNNVYAITDSTSKLKGYFNKGKANPTAIKWGERTFETAACLGLSFDPYPYMEPFEKFNKKSNVTALLKPYMAALKEVKSAIKNSKGEALGGQELLAKLDTKNPTTANVADMLKLLGLANGAHIFGKQFGCLGWSFIHKSIGDYYDAESQNPYIEHESGKHKDNTADTIFYSGNNVKKFLNEIATEKISTDDKGKCTTESGTSFYQISNKESEKGAQLGRFKEIVDDKFGLKSAKDRFAVYLTNESLLYNLDEGLGDWVKRAASKVKDKFSSFVNKIKEKLNQFSQSIFKALNLNKKSTTPPKSVQDLIDKSVNEAKGLSYSEYAGLCATEFIEGDTSRMKGIYDLANQEWNNLEKVVKGMDGGIFTPGSEGPTFPTKLKDVNEGVNLTLKYMTNVTAYQDLQTMFKSEGSNIKKSTEVLEDFVDFEKEIYFGRTTLPLYKLYSEDKASGKPWSFLDDGKGYKEKRKSIIDEFKSKNIPGVIVESNVQEKKGGYCRVSIYVFTNFNETNGLEYTQVDLRSGSSDTYSYSISASSTVSYAKLKSNKDI